MAIEKIINITVNTKGETKAIAQTEKLNASFKQLNATTGQTKSALKESGNAILENGGAMGLLNDATGGLAMTVKDAVEATALFSKGTTIATTAQKIYTLVVGTTTGALKALRIALVSTGLGAIVVLLGLFIAKMNESAEATENEKSATDALNASLSRMSDLYKQNISDLETVNKERVLRAKIAGKSEKDILAIEQETSEERNRIYKEEQNRILKQLENNKLTAEARKKLNDELLANDKEYFKYLNDEKIKDLEGDLSVADAKRQAQKDRLAKEAEDRAKAVEEAKKKREEEQKELLDEADRFFKEAQEREKERLEQDTALKLEQVDILNKGITESDEDKNNRLLANAEETARKQKQIDEAVTNAKLDITKNTIGLISEIVGQGSKVGKGLAVAQATISGYEGVQNAFTTAQKSPITTLFPAYPFIQAGLAGAFSALQIKKILSTDPTGRSGGGSPQSGGGSAPSAPSFNLVQGTGSNQIAEGLATQRRPLQAYVVANNVTSAQALDRNIINDASI
jgi:hypothetical protein